MLVPEFEECWMRARGKDLGRGRPRFLRVWQVWGAPVSDLPELGKSANVDAPISDL